MISEKKKKETRKRTKDVRQNEEVKGKTGATRGWGEPLTGGVFFSGSFSFSFNTFWIKSTKLVKKERVLLKLVQLLLCLILGQSLTRAAIVDGAIKNFSGCTTN